MDDDPSIADRLAELQQLHDNGLLTDDELTQRRASLLDELTAAPATPTAPEAPTKSTSGTPGRRTPEEQAAYKAANPKKGVSTGAKVALGGVAVVVIFWALAALPGDDNRTGPPTAATRPHSTEPLSATKQRTRQASESPFR
jgi:cytochrome c-type biogenesis protein CcmH/NrfG